MIDNILELISGISTPRFFVTVDFISTSSTYMPTKIEIFIQEKLYLIQSGITGRKFKYTEGDWLLFLTFYPTDQKVEERYAMKNKMIKKATHHFSQMNLHSEK